MRTCICLLFIIGLLHFPTYLGAQSRDLHAERIVLDDNTNDGTLNRVTIQTPVTGLPQNLTLTIPDPGITDAFFVLSTTPTFANHNINATLSGDGSVGTPYGINLANANTWTAQQTLSDADVLLANTTNSAGQLQLAEPSGSGTNMTTFEAGTQAADINYILPTVPPTVNGQVLAATTTGVMSWVTAGSGSSWNLTGNAGTTPGTDFVGTTDVQALHLLVNSGTDNSLILNTNGSIQRDAGGDARGDSAVDLQIMRSVVTEVASGQFAVISGGTGNTASGYGATVGGGWNNSASRVLATVGGGRDNTASSSGVVGGGEENTASGDLSTVGGGWINQASAWSSTVGGGTGNVASEEHATVGGGETNTASSFRATVGGGKDNTASGLDAFVGGGGDNTASGITSTVGGGANNQASGLVAFVGGGRNNTAAGDYSAIPGGRGLTLNGSGSFGFLGANAGLNNMTIAANNIAAFANTDLWLANNNNNASQLRFYEANNSFSAIFPPPAIFYTSFEAGNQAANISYTLPTTTPTTNGQILTATTAGVMSWSRANSLSHTSLGANYTMTVTDAIVGANAVGITITLSSAAAVSAGTILVIKDETGIASGATPGTTDITISATGVETIDGVATQAISTAYGSVRLYSDGTNWFTY